MSRLTDAFVEAEANRQDAIFGPWIGDVISKALTPFKPGIITLEMPQDPDLFDFSRTLVITTELLPGLPFQYKLDQRHVLQAYDPGSYLVDAITNPLFMHFRYRPSLPVDDHIILGEE